MRVTRHGSAGALFVVCLTFLAGLELWIPGRSRVVLAHDPRLPEVSGPVATVSAIPLGLMSPVYPIGRPPGDAEVELGRRLFFDAVLSRDGSVNCATCHSPEHGFADPRARSIGITGQPGRRNSPTLLNVAYFDSFGWDGRHNTIEAQTLDAITNVEEMGLEHDQIAPRVEPTYGAEIRRVYGEMSVEAVLRALAAYQRSLLAGGSPFDRYLYRGERDAISESAKRGFDIFLRQGRCIQCHMIRCDDCHPFGGTTAFFFNNRFHNLGVGFVRGLAPQDAGRVEFTGRPEHTHAFRTPSLRNVELTAPYMHDGSIATLEDVVEFYARGGNPNVHLDPEIRRLNLTRQQKADLVSFLRSLTSTQLPR
jgi:cytochrome c peroxidase